MKKSKKLKQETLRIDRTELNQDQFAMKCGIPRATYQRWITGKTEARLTLSQVKKLCLELSIKDVQELPDNF